jgi:hypothetical protein
MTTLSQRVKGAVLTAPYLLKNIQQIQGYNPTITNRVISRLLPFRSSVEIEHFNIDGHIYITELFHNKSYPKKDDIHLLSYDSPWSSVTETKISITNNINELIHLYNILETLKEIGREDENGSIHIHIDISNWWNNMEIKASPSAIGLYIMSTSWANIVTDFLNKFLDSVANIFDYPINLETFDFEYGLPKNRINKDMGTLQGNIRTINIHTPYHISHRNDNYRDVINYINDLCDIERKRREKGIPSMNGKFNWVNMRILGDSNQTMEYRVGDCSFDYSTILKYFVECNHLTKTFLNFADYIGKRVIRQGFKEFFPSS